MSRVVHIRGLPKVISTVRERTDNEIAIRNASVHIVRRARIGFRICTHSPDRRPPVDASEVNHLHNLCFLSVVRFGSRSVLAFDFVENEFSVRQCRDAHFFEVLIAQFAQNNFERVSVGKSILYEQFAVLQKTEVSEPRNQSQLARLRLKLIMCRRRRLTGDFLGRGIFLSAHSPAQSGDGTRETAKHRHTDHAQHCNPQCICVVDILNDHAVFGCVRGNQRRR